MYTAERQFFNTMNINIPKISSIMAGFIAGIILLEILVPQPAIAKTHNQPPVATIVKYEVVKKVKMIITAYSSTPSQTDSTPFITASGKEVADGIIANNLLPFGTKVRIPQLYGDKVFVVEDRMHSRKGKYHADIWMPEYSQAKNFGAKITEIEILES